MSNPKKTPKMPHTLVILMIIILIVTALTWIIPSGEYNRIKDEVSGKKIIDPASFHYVDKAPVNPLSVPIMAVEGFVKVADLIFVILFSGAAFHIITKSNALQSLISMVARKTKNKATLFIPALTLVFGLICTTQGVNTFIGFAPVMVMIALALGYDSIVGASIILLGGAVGFSTGTLNVNTTIVAQKIAGLPPYSGLDYRAVSFVVFYLATNFYLVRYAMKIQKKPTLSPMYDLDQTRESVQSSMQMEEEKMNLRKWGVLFSLFAVLAIIVYGGIKLKWGLSQTAGMFLYLGIVAGFIAGFKPSEIAKHFTDGAKKMIGAALIIGLARTVSIVLDAGKIMDTSIHALSSVIGKVPWILRGPVMFIVNIIVNIFITSGSGQAAAVMPIFAPMADTVNMSRQTAILALNFGDGFCNYILPTSTALMGTLGATDIPYDRWMKFMGKLFVIWVLIGSLLMVGAQLIGYQ